MKIKGFGNLATQTSDSLEVRCTKGRFIIGAVSIKFVITTVYRNYWLVSVKIFAFIPYLCLFDVFIKPISLGLLTLFRHLLK